MGGGWGHLLDLASEFSCPCWVCRRRRPSGTENSADGGRFSLRFGPCHNAEWLLERTAWLEVEIPVVCGR